jgi:hypothetical protein
MKSKNDILNSLFKLANMVDANKIVGYKMSFNPYVDQLCSMPCIIFILATCQCQFKEMFQPFQRI